MSPKSRFSRTAGIFDPIQPKAGIEVHRQAFLNFEETLLQGDASQTAGEAREMLTKRMRFSLVLVVGIFVLLIGRVFFLQIVSGKTYDNLAQGNRIRIQSEQAPRGLVYDARKRALVHNVASFNVAAVPIDLPKDDQERNRLITDLARVLGKKPEDVASVFANLISYSSAPVSVQENISREAAMILNANYDKFPGIVVQNSSRREYDNGPLFAHILGFTGKITQLEFDTHKNDAGDPYLLTDPIGKTGVESTYEQDLRGEHGKNQVEVDSLGRVENVLARKEPVSGKGVVLTIDRDVQQKLTDLLAEAAHKAGSSKASAVMLNPQNGEVLALVSLPSYDNNLFAQGISSDDYNRLLQDKDRPMFNRAIAGIYPPGSTIKPVVGAAALQEGIVTPQTTIVDKGVIVVPNQYDSKITYRFVGWKPQGLGPMNIYSAIALSSDIYFYTVAGGFEKIKGLGADKVLHYFTLFRLGAKLGIDLPQESAGLVPSPAWKQRVKGEAWYLGDTYHVGIGQGDLLTTPLQVVNYTATIANGGTMYKPHVAKQLLDSDGQVVQEVQPVKLVRQIVDEKNIQIIRDAMRQTVTSGSGRLLNTLPVSAAGKTGTAQFDNNASTHAWFEAFAPFDKPEVALVVMVEGGGEGNETAVPVARDMLQWYFTDYKNSLK